MTPIPRIKALRLASQYFYIMAHGGSFPAKTLENMASVCALAIPIKYRFSREELDTMKKVALEQPEPKDTHDQGKV